VQVTADVERCCGSGNCVLIAPEVFDQTQDEGVVVVLRPQPPEHLHGAVLEAARVCPTQAIGLRPDPAAQP
jgi:ferredoxin